MARSITTRSTNPKIMDDNIKLLDDAIAAASTPEASDVSYDNTDSGLTADDVQNAIDEIAEALNDKVEVISDGTKTYAQLLEALLDLIDTDKVTNKSCLIIETDNKDFIYPVNYINLATGGMDFSRASLALSGSDYVTWITFINMRASGNSKNIELLGTTVTDNSSETVASSVKFIFKY